ncbi:epoxide hydrolase 1 [Neohortaea acidophila]|uniref:Epoxide hydrolase 1 n=1 Tax=Neohortaea acidophila TaxID=245834 RepID=A0A6A6PTU7_9PEZI|nr:epoxide hydrolase 1 [Neohortaea acidophila]KAF2483104.1 epoxide hydrolase 1 [Neohortaea acidophila]
MASTITKIAPFSVQVPDSELSDLKSRLQSTRYPAAEITSGWSHGVPLQAMRELTNYWIEKYDWRKCEAWLNSHEQFLASYEGEEIYFLHIKSKHAEAMPMLLVHGWPGSILEFRKAVGPLTDPTQYGGKAEDAFHLVIPSLPGYGWSTAKSEWSHRRINKAFVALMVKLGYDQWVAQGGDWGGDLVAILASENPPASLVGVHLNTIFFNVPKEVGGRKDLSPGEQRAVRQMEAWDGTEDAYLMLQATRPQTIGYSLADSPVGQAAWILEKIHGWSHHRGDVYEILTKDEILDNIMIYWLTNTGSTSARLYTQQNHDWTMGTRIEIPIGVTLFPGDASYVPRSWAEKYYSRIIHWRDAEKGGHFAAWEVPEIFVQEVRDTFRHVRS